MMMSSSSSSSSLAGKSGTDYAAAAAAADAAAPHPQVVRKAMWSPKEDRVLRDQVRLHGPHSWDTICIALPERNAKSCRLRWCQHLDPRVDVVRPFTPEEDRVIINCQAKYGNRWSTIAEFLSGRTDNAIKNRWNSVLRKQQAAAATADPDQAPPRHQHFIAPSASAVPRPEAGASEVSPGCLKLFPLEKGDVRMDRRSPPLPHHAPEDDVDMSDAETTSPAPTDCLQLFPLAPGEVVRAANAGAAASSGMSCGADDPLSQLRLAPAARMVFDVMPLRAYHM